MGSDDRELLFLYERGKKKLMDAAQVIFRGEWLLQLFIILFSLWLKCDLLVIFVFLMGLFKKHIQSSMVHLDMFCWLKHFVYKTFCMDNWCIFGWFWMYWWLHAICYIETKNPPSQSWCASWWMYAMKNPQSHHKTVNRTKGGMPGRQEIYLLSLQKPMVD